MSNAHRPALEVQGHRGARGLGPENTLAGFEIALDLGVTSIETDVHLTKDNVPILCHDANITAALCEVRPGHDLPATDPLVRSLTLEQLRGYRVRGPANSTPLAYRFANERGIDPRGIPTLAEFFEFVAAYAGPLGVQAAKTASQQERARRLLFDLELKRVPFRAETIGDGFTGNAPARLENSVLEAIHRAGVLHRTRVRSFDHRCVFVLKQLDMTLATGVLLNNTVVGQIAKFLADMRADLYCPDFHFVDADVVRQVHAAGRRIIPYTVNEEEAWDRLVAWGVDGITTDYPDRLIAWLHRRGLPMA